MVCRSCYHTGDTLCNIDQLDTTDTCHHFVQSHMHNLGCKEDDSNQKRFRPLMWRYQLFNCWQVGIVIIWIFRSSPNVAFQTKQNGFGYSTKLYALLSYFLELTLPDVALWLYTIVVILTKQKFSVGCVMELAFQLTHNSRSSIGYQTVTDAHENKGLKGSNSLLWIAHYWTT